MTKEEIQTLTDDTLDEIEELEVNQHTQFYKDEPRGRERMAMLLLKLNALEEWGERNGIGTLQTS